MQKKGRCSAQGRVEKMNDLFLQRLKNGSLESGPTIRDVPFLLSPFSLSFIFQGTPRGWQDPSPDSLAAETSSHLRGFASSLAWGSAHL